MKMDKFVEGLKSLVENFSKQTSLNVLAFAGAITAIFIYYRSGSDKGLYAAFGCLVFLCVNLLVSYVPKARQKLIKWRFKQKINNPEWQKQFLANLDSYELDVLQDLYESYPKSNMYDADSPVIIKLHDKGMLRISSQAALSRYGVVSAHCYLQPWVKKAMENNKEFIRKEDVDDYESSDIRTGLW